MVDHPRLPERERHGTKNSPADAPAFRAHVLARYFAGMAGWRDWLLGRSAAHHQSRPASGAARGAAEAARNQAGSGEGVFAALLRQSATPRLTPCLTS